MGDLVFNGGMIVEIYGSIHLCNENSGKFGIWAGNQQ